MDHDWKGKMFLIFKIASLQRTRLFGADAIMDNMSFGDVIPLYMPPELSLQMTLLFSFLLNDRLVYLSRNFTLCLS